MVVVVGYELFMRRMIMTHSILRLKLPFASMMMVTVVGWELSIRHVVVTCATLRRRWAPFGRMRRVNVVAHELFVRFMVVAHFWLSMCMPFLSLSPSSLFAALPICLVAGPAMT